MKRPAAGPPPGLDGAGMNSDMVTTIRDLRCEQNKIMAKIIHIRQDIQKINTDLRVLVDLIHPNGPLINQLEERAEVAMASEAMVSEAIASEAMAQSDAAMASEAMNHGDAAAEAKAQLDVATRDDDDTEAQAAGRAKSPSDDSFVDVVPTGSN